MFEQDIMITLLDIILLGLKMSNNLSVNHSARPCAVDEVLEAMHQVLRKKYPQFGQLHNGSFMQQDAEECWTQNLYTLSQSLRSPSSSVNIEAVKQLFGIDVVSRLCLMNLLASVAAGELSRSDASPPYYPSNISVANGHIKFGHISFVDAFSTKGISSQQVLPPT
ncbi:hypothetical protein Tco_0575644 [Tanacetum coccineum]